MANGNYIPQKSRTQSNIHSKYFVVVIQSILYEIFSISHLHFVDIPRQLPKYSYSVFHNMHNVFCAVFWWGYNVCSSGYLWHINPMMTSSNGNIFYVTSPLCGQSPVASDFPAQRSVTWSFHVFFDLCLNKRLSKQSWGWWFETPSRPLWRHCNDIPTDYLNDSPVSVE